jgi:hypothetical protein
VKQLADFRGVGEINLVGSISWSNFAAWEKATPQPALQISPPTDPEPAQKDPAVSLNQHVIVRELEPKVGVIQDFAYAAGPRRFLISDNEEALWTWGDNGKSATRIEAELPFASLGATRGGEFYYHGGQTNELRRVRTGMPIVKSKLFLGFMAPGAAQDSILVVEDDSIVGTPSPVWRLADSKMKQLGQLETTGMVSAVEWIDGDIYYTTDANSLYRWRDGQIVEFCRGLSEPRLLACDQSFLYCLSATSRTLHRISKTGEVVRANLDEANLDRDQNRRGFQTAGEGRLLIADGQKVAELDATRLNWK